MGRVIRNWTPDLVADATVKPYSSDFGDYTKTDYDGFIAGLSYKEGDVIYVAVGGEAKKAKIVGIFVKRNSEGYPIAKFRVLLETAKGLWSKNWEHTWPGIIQRDYAIAAPLEISA
jgi:hypothetical protein